MRLRLSVSSKVLRLAVLAKRLAVAVGQFIKIKSFENSIGVTSTPIVVLSKVLSDAASVSETSSVEPKKNIFSGIGFDDGEPYFLEDYVAEDYVLGPQVIKVFTKAPIATNVGVLSQPALTFQRSFSDQFFATDDVDGELTDQDDVTLEFFKATDNTPALSDVSIFGVSKVLLDLPQVSSSGILISQNYTEDATYFAEDYVGESRTFS